MNTVTEQMECGLRELQTVGRSAYADAYWAALGGIHTLDPRKGGFDADLIYGRMLALRTWIDRQKICRVVA